MAGFFVLVGAGPLVRGHDVRWSFVLVGAVFLSLALVRPATLGPLNRLWMRFGLLLNRVTSPIVLAVLFYAVVTPFALVMRAVGKTPLTLHRDPSAGTYWIDKPSSTTEPASMTRQF